MRATKYANIIALVISHPRCEYAARTSYGYSTGRGVLVWSGAFTEALVEPKQASTQVLQEVCAYHMHRWCRAACTVSVFKLKIHPPLIRRKRLRRAHNWQGMDQGYHGSHSGAKVGQ